MKILALLTLFALFACSYAQTTAFTAEQITSYLASKQNSRPAVYLSANGVLFTDEDTYQKRALERTIEALAGKPGVTQNDIDHYYVLSCIYEATNGVSNPRVVNIEGQDAVIPNWLVTTGWFVTDDYCLWFGIQCYDERADAATQTAQAAQKKVLGINLSENDLYGEWPSEIGFLGKHLIYLDLYANDYLWTIKFNWFLAMDALKYLFFGTTSFDANGIPVNLRFLESLEEIDFSNTFWRGTLTPAAFNNLKQLRYLDMGRNFFDIANLVTLPDFISGLPLLSNLYIDNIKSTKTTGSKSIKLDFMVRMVNLVEMWMDYTRVEGPLPINIGNLKSLQSLSLVYCKINGTIPDSIVNTALSKLWIYGNPNLTGDFPSGFPGNLKFNLLYMEGTGIIVSFPKALCNQRGPDETQDLLELGGSAKMCPGEDNCCTCIGSGCGNLRSPTPAPAPSGFICFSGDSTVNVENQGLVKMSNLAIGDSIQVADNKFEEVYSFGHINHDEVGTFLTILAEGNRKIELSEDHMVTIEGGRNVPASMIKRGDKLLTASGELASVKTIREVKRQGLYAPFTSSGNMVVNDVVASNYVAFQGESNLHIAGVETPLSFQWIAHIFKSVHRVAYKLGLAGTETYTPDGTSQWVSGGHAAGRWLLEQSSVVTAALLVPAIAFFGVASLFEFFLVDNVFATAVVGLLTLVFARRFVSVKMTNKL